MLDFDFAKLLIIFVLALVVLGPEKLPRVAAQVGRWIGRARGMARQFREQLEEEVTLEETRKSQAAAAAAKPANPVPPTDSAPAGVPQSETTPPESAPPTSAAPTEPMSRMSVAPPEPEPAITYPDYYSHAHPTDSEGRPLPAPQETQPTQPPVEPHPSHAQMTPPVDPRQQDWIGGATAPDKPSLAAVDAAYAPPHERGT